MRCRAYASTIALLLCVNSLIVAPKAIAARQPDLETWVSQTVTPFVAEQLVTHPRFKGELVRFIVFTDGSPAPMSNALSIALRDRLASAVIDIPGVRVTPPANPDTTTIDCTRDTAHYYVGLQISTIDGDEHRVDLRALDLEDGSWVAGFGLSWQGSMSRSQRGALQRPQADTFFQGQRDVPFATSQKDLLAANLAHELGCAILRQVSGEYVVRPDHESVVEASLDGVVELVGNNLAGHQALQLTKDSSRANAVLRGKAHAVDRDLHQYWVTIAPVDPGSDLPTLSVSAYVQLPNTQGRQNSIPRSSHDVLSSIRIVEVSDRRACDFHAESCFAMQVKTSQDAVVFFLNHQRNHGLVRLSGRDCAARTAARIARADETVNQPLPLHALLHNAATAADSWAVNPDAETYYAIAVNDSKVARLVSQHLQKLPQRCTEAVRFGLEGVQLENWLAELSSALADWQAHVDWQAVQVKNVY